MKTVDNSQSNNVNNFINILFAQGSVQIENSDKAVISKLREKVLFNLNKLGIRNIHCIINRNIIELT